MRLWKLSLAIAVVHLAVSAECRSQTAAAFPPSSVETSICRPTLRVDGHDFVAGTGFALSIVKGGRSRLLMVTAKHLFGPDGGLEKDVPWNEMPARASLTKCVSMQNGAIWQADPPLAIEGSEPVRTTAFARDIAIFPLREVFSTGQATTLRLAAAAPKVGDSVWVIARLLRGAPPSQLLHHATVVSSGAWVLQYKFENSAYDIQATSGAPVVNAAGEVVGVNLGGGPKNGELFGYGDSLSAVKSAFAVAKPQ